MDTNLSTPKFSIFAKLPPPASLDFLIWIGRSDCPLGFGFGPFGTENMSLDRYRIVKCFSNSLLTALILVNAVAVAQLWQAVARVLIGARRQGLQESFSESQILFLLTDASGSRRDIFSP